MYGTVVMLLCICIIIVISEFQDINCTEKGEIIVSKVPFTRAPARTLIRGCISIYLGFSRKISFEIKLIFELARV